MDGMIHFEVADRGVGLSPQQVKRIFERYYRVDQRLAKVNGCGIGLSIVDLVAKTHHGNVTVESEMNQGSRFTIRIPMERL